MIPIEASRDLGTGLQSLESVVLLVHRSAAGPVRPAVGLALCLHVGLDDPPTRRFSSAGYWLLRTPPSATCAGFRSCSHRCRRYRCRRHPPRPPARKPVAAARRASRASLERTPPPTALAHSEHNVAAPTPPRAAPQQGGTRTERTSLAPCRALATLAWRGRGSARRESGARRATACGRAVP